MTSLIKKQNAILKKLRDELRHRSPIFFLNFANKSIDYELRHYSYW